MSAWAGAAVDRSVAAAGSGRPLHDGAPLIGVTALGNIRSVALGGALDTTPGINGDGRLAMAVLLGFQPEVDSTRLQFLGEAGRHRFLDVGDNICPTSRPETWLPYLGVRLGVARTVPARGLFELGAWLFGRYDIGEATVTNVGSFLGRGDPDRLPRGRLDVRAGAAGRAAPRGRGLAPLGRDDGREISRAGSGSRSTPTRGLRPHCRAPVSLRTTHASWVFLVGDDVWKVKRPVDLGFLDFRTLAGAATVLRGRGAPQSAPGAGVYLGVEPVRQRHGRPRDRRWGGARSSTGRCTCGACPTRRARRRCWRGTLWRRSGWPRWRSGWRPSFARRVRRRSSASRTSCAPTSTRTSRRSRRSSAI